MSKLDPVKLFQRLCNDIPVDLHKDVFVTGSLAAAYAFKVKLQGQAVNTKDADLLVHPAGNIGSAQKMAERLLNIGWRPTERCKPLMGKPVNRENLEAIRLMPPASDEYFIEFLNLPIQEQGKMKDWIEVEVNGGWYGVTLHPFATQIEVAIKIIAMFGACTDCAIDAGMIHHRASAWPRNILRNMLRDNLRNRRRT